MENEEIKNSYDLQWPCNTTELAIPVNYRKMLCHCPIPLFLASCPVPEVALSSVDKYLLEIL
jgi:hypothetical protein